MRINIKPLSVNKAWQGKRFKTNDYKAFEEECLYRLPKMEIKAPKELYLRFGVSNMRMDWDNGVKPFQDILQKKYDFDDCSIVKATVEKVKVKKGEEFIEFSFS